MAFDITAIKRELDASPPWVDLPWATGVAIVSDVFRRAGLVPPVPRAWEGWRQKAPHAPELVQELARALTTPALCTASVSALEASRPPATDALAGFLEAASPLTSEMVRTNPFRQEEFVRYWIVGCGGTVSGESAAESRARLERLDYRQALAAYRQAETGRKAEAQRRAQLLREAKEREEHAKGWRE